jgi:hypothetical protein
MLDEIKVDYPEVLAAAREVVARVDDPQAGWWRSYELPGLLAKRLGVLGQWAYSNVGSRERAAALRFDRQVMRAFNELAAEGTLRKVCRGECTPAGQTLGNEAQFYTPAAWTAAEARKAEAQQVRSLTVSAWEHVYDRLSEHGLAPLSGRGQPVDLALPVWAELLGRLD